MVHLEVKRIVPVEVFSVIASVAISIVIPSFTAASRQAFGSSVHGPHMGSLSPLL
jgi:hypothetical protein